VTEVDQPVESLPEDQQPDHLPDYVDVVDPEPWFGLICDRFGISREAFDGYLLHRPSKKSLNIVPADHLPPGQPEPDAIGLRFIRTHMRHPKMTTAAAMAFGRRASRNVVDLTAEQIDRYASRRQVVLSAERAERCTDTGYVLVGHRGVLLGVGLFFADEVGGRRPGRSTPPSRSPDPRPPLHSARLLPAADEDDSQDGQHDDRQGDKERDSDIFSHISPPCRVPPKYIHGWRI
jgi:NOL1/NOP2/fmu family ribosome biogenesis protein